MEDCSRGQQAELALGIWPMTEVATRHSHCYAESAIPTSCDRLGEFGMGEFWLTGGLYVVVRYRGSLGSEPADSR